MTAYQGPLGGERMTPAQAEALFDAFPGIAIYADLVAAGLAARGVETSDTAADMVTAAPLARTLEARQRLPGIRDPLYDHHPVTIALRAALDRAPDALPEPDECIVARLEAVGCVRNGRIISFNDVPVPAGAAQTAYFVVLRYRPLFSPVADPARIYRGDLAYDASAVTDEMQESILLVSTRIHRDNLLRLQHTAPALFVAIWMREAVLTEQLVKDVPVGELPPCYPRSRLTDRRKCVMIVADAMHEHERAFDLLDAVKFYTGVTRDSVKAALLSCTNMTAIRKIANDTGRHIAAGVAHVRSMHPTMNAKPPRAGVDTVFEQVRSGFEQSAVYGRQYRHVTWVMGDMPTRYFLGVEPTMLIAVHLIQMRETMIRHEGKFWLGPRGRLDSCRDKIAMRVMGLATVVTSNVCIPTARSILSDDGLLLDSVWLRQSIVPLIRNPAMQDTLEKQDQGRDDETLSDARASAVPADGDIRDEGEPFKNTYRGALHRARLCSSSIGEPGWTQGFRFDAWRQPHAEVPFLRKCCSYIQFDQQQADLRDRWLKALQRAGKLGKDGAPITAADVHTGFPRQHPVECAQDFSRDQFDPLQVADLVKDAEKSDAARRREAYVVELAAMLPALIAITDDPALNERFWIDRNSSAVRFAAQAAWNS